MSCLFFGLSSLPSKFWMGLESTVNSLLGFRPDWAPPKHLFVRFSGPSKDLVGFPKRQTPGLTGSCVPLLWPWSDIS